MLIKLSERDEAQGARSAGTEAYRNMLRLRAPRNVAIRPLRQLISVSLARIVHTDSIPFINHAGLV